MSRKDWILVILLPLIATWGLDRVTKVLASGLTGVKFYGPFGLVLHHNYGAILGLFSELPSVLRVVSLSTGGAFLIFSFFAIQYLLPSKSVALRSGMSFLMGGIVGNVTDRILYGYVVDFLIIGTPKNSSPAFNVADAVQWVGYVLIVVALIKEGKNLWPEGDLRKSYWINPRFQLAYCFKLMSAGLGFAVIAGTYSYSYFRVTINELIGHQQQIENRFLVPFIVTFLIVTFSFLVILFLVGLILSHRSAGPIYAFERFLEDLAVGKVRPLKLRAGDEFLHLEELSRKLTQSATVFAVTDTTAPEELSEGTPAPSSDVPPQPFYSHPQDESVNFGAQELDIENGQDDEDDLELPPIPVSTGTGS